MDPHPPCPLCASQDRHVLGTARYTRASIADATPYVARRLRVLFDLWSGGGDAFTLTWSGCPRCGLVVTLPRPTADDLDRKYRFLSDPEHGADGTSPHREVEGRRAADLDRLVRGLLPSGGGRVLDFGGGDGHLVAPLAARGHRCALVDYGRDAVPGVERRGATLDDLPAGDAFDLVVCSHVLEHVADPVDVLGRLGRHLTPTGALYVEVPMELWRGVPRMEEPVTHVNFFVPASLRAALGAAGLEARRCGLSTYLHPSQGRQLAVKALAWRGSPGDVRTAVWPGDAEVRSLLHPGLLTQLRVARLRPRRALAALWRRLTGR